MADLSPKKYEMQVQPPCERSKNFKEVALGYTKEQAVKEANRCLHCPTKPCVSGCPVNINIPDFINEIALGNFDKAYEIINKESSLPAICGRVCPQENQCEGSCARGKKCDSVAIGRLERFVADYHNEQQLKASKKESNGIKIAVVGSGPSGLSCAGELCKLGYDVTIFEALHKAGGVLQYGIPEFRLPKSIVEQEIDNLKEMGVKIVTDCVIGKTVTIDELLDERGFKSVFIGTGAGLPKFMNISGENFNGVFSANEFLTRINLMKAYKENSATPIYKGKNVVVVGGGNVAMDSARSALRLGGKVTIVYRRTENELPARKEEVEHAKEEGVNFLFLTNPIKINGNSDFWTESVTVQKMELSTPDASGRAKPIPIANSEYDIVADCVIMALGTSPNPLIKNTTKGLDTSTWGGIIADKNGLTSLKGVYAGGDAVTGAATVILAMGAGKHSAKAIDEYIKSNS